MFAVGVAVLPRCHLCKSSLASGSLSPISVVVTMAFDACSWLLFAAVLVNQAGRVMIPAIKTSVLVDPDFAPAFEQNVGAMRPEPSPQP